MQNYAKLVGKTLLFLATASFATEAWSPIAYGVKAKGMGGVSIGTVHGAESGFSNPSLLSFVKGNEASIGVTYLNIKSKVFDSTNSLSNSDNTYSPYLAMNYHVTNKMSVGLDVSRFSLKAGTGNIGVDSMLDTYRETKVNIPMSYKINNFSFGATLLYEHRSLDFDFSRVSSWNSHSSNGYGYDLGISYDLPNEGILLGFNYKSEIKHMVYESTDPTDYYAGYLNSPQEIGVGISWKIPNTSHTIAMDYKKIDSSELLKDTSISELITKDQNVFAVGYMYSTENWSIKAGYKYVSDLYSDNLSGDNLLMYLIYPYYANSNYTLGGNYTFADNLSVDTAMVYGHSSKSIENVNIKINSLSISLGLNYKF